MAGQEVQGMLIRLEATTAQLRQEMARADSTVAQVSGRIDRQLSTVDSAFARAGQSALSAGNMVRGAMAAVAGGMSISSLVAQADAYATIASRLRLVTSSAAEFNAAQKAVFSIAQSSYQPLTATAELYQRIATNQKELKLTGEGVAGVVGTISKTLAISGASASSANAALIQLGQAFASGVLRGEELNSVMEQAPALAQAIAAGMGKTVGQLRALGAEGKLTADAVVKALQSQQKAVDDLYGKTAVTIGNSITAMGNSYTQLVGRIDQAGGASARIASVIVDVSKAIDTLTADGAATERNFARVSSVAETLAAIIGGRLALAAGQMVVGFVAATKASLQQAISLATSTSATIKQLEADAAAAKQAVLTAKSRQADAQAMLARANAEVAAAEQKVAADRMRQQSEINNLKTVQATLAAERVLEESRLAAQITEQGRSAARTRMAEARLAEVAIIKQIQAAEVQLAATTVAASAEVQAAYAGKTAAVTALGETTLAVNAAIRTSEATTAAASSASKAMLLAGAAGKGLLALLTGPVGLIAMTAAVAYSFFNVGSSADDATSSLIAHNETVDESISKYKVLSAEQQRLQKITWAEQQIEALDAAGSALDDYAYKIERSVNLGPMKAEFRGMIEEVEAGKKPLESVTAWIEKNAKLTPAFSKELAVLASQYQKNTKDADDLSKKIIGVDSATTKATTSTEQLKAAQAGGGQTQATKDAWDKYIEQLTKTRDLLGANAAAEAAYTAAKMGATPAQAAQAKIIAEQTDTLKKYQDAIKEGNKVQQDSLKLQLVALYAAEDAATQAAAVQSKAYADTATAAETSSTRQITAIEKAANFAIASAARVATGSSAAAPTGYSLLTNGAAPVVAPVAAPAAPVRQSPLERADADIARLNQTTEANKRVDKSANEAARALKAQAKALEELLAKSGISAQAANAMADAYLSGADNVRALTIQQEIEQELLRTGAGARDKVTAAVNALHDAEDRRDVAKTIASMKVEIEQTQVQAKATLEGTAALEAFNVEKAVQAELVGKNIKVGSEEYKQLVATTKAQLEANKALEQAGQVQGIVDRLNPEIKLLKDYTEEHKALTAAMEMYPGKAGLYGDALVKLGNEYEVNRSKATIWGQMTKGAIDRIDDAFATAWGNIGDGAESLWDNLKKGFKQTLGEIAHMLTTKPLLASISNWLTGTDNGQGLGSVWGKLLGSVSGSGSGSSGGFGLGTIADIGKTVYQAFSTITGVGSSIASGWASGGVTGAIQGGVGYYANLFTGAASTVTSTLASWTAAITGNTAAIGATQAGYTGAAFAQWAAAQAGGGVAAGAGAGAAAGAAAGGAAAGAGSGFMASMAAMASNPVGWVVAAVTSAYQSGKLYDQGYRYDMKETLTDKNTLAAGGILMEPAFNIGITDKVFSKLFGGKIAAILSGSALFGSVLGGISSKIFGGKWETKDGGLSLGVTDGEFDAQQYIYQKKKGGLFSSNKKRTQYSDPDEATAGALGGAFNAKILDSLGLFTQLGVQMGDSVLDGLNVAATQISTQGRTNEEIQAELDKWFVGLGDAAVQAISKATGSGIDDMTFDNMKVFIERLYSVNTTLDLLNVGLIQTSVFGGKMAEQLVAWAGGMEAFTTATNGYYSNFFSETEKADDTLAAVNKQFAQLNIALPESRAGYRAMIEAIDIQTEAGRQMFVTLTGLAENAAAAYTIMEDRATAATQVAADAAQAIIDQLMGAVGASQSALQRAIAAEQEAATTAYNARITSLNDMSSTASKSVTDLTSVSNSLSAALKTLRGDSDDAVKMLRAQAQATLQSALATARSGGSLAGFTGLDDALDVVSTTNTDLYGSMEDFARDQGRTANVVAELNALNGKQLTTAEKTVKTLQDQLDQAKAAYDAQMAQFDQQLEFAQAQMDALNGVDNSVKSVADAVRKMNAAVVTALGVLSGKGTATNNGTLIDSVYQDVLGRDADAAGKNYWQGELSSGAIGYDQLAGAIKNAAAEKVIKDAYASVLGRGADADGAKYWSDQVASGALTVGQLQQAIANAAKANGSVPAFAAGGFHTGGMRLVGENGPELEITGPSRIFNASQTASMLRGDGSGEAATVAELRGLRREMQTNFEYISKHIKATADHTDEIANRGVQVVGTVDTKVVA